MVRHILYMASIGYGESWTTLQLLLQQVLNRIKSANPTRLTGLEDRGQLPTISWVRRFTERHNLTLRKASIISKGRAVISPQDITLWFKDIEQFFTSNLEIKEALSDPRRVFNQEETAIEHGVGNMYVLAMKGEKQCTVCLAARQTILLSHSL